ncbi:MAG TPA: hypothetical protein DCQ26_05995 [Marinilabiliales bacterium]|jgi:ABC-type transporter Mla MlaB component|nr:STAS domain-containing protein [Salinivirgaceae bacterium]OFX41234.1 MAG: hypothetical protein A2W95_01930 [Bacteroidetes bacterium GWA2_40_14]OFX61925.1 MAG: hypothetical protein A2W84_13115 [Bacteroidetes bacterium GWC2_40_13]OFX74072.1 MAG: hypothetical protein A2W96_12225 [Bacteroidetes bacterium GWD2_40_43]OFX93094.1 MAG: hypothetical protein A2W97_05850 [Bacteroidetes bacterium GWE2_40_63]OFY21464.1 MAG: hypothetical protein A2W88_09850 [Bacteroidetes bacterium GWF2_40_13]OFZ25113.1 
MKEFQVSSTKDKKNNSVNLTMKGKLTISNMAQIEQEFKKAVKDCNKCVIVLSEVEEADLSILQLLKAFELTCKKKKIDVTINMNLNEDHASLFAKSGLNSIFN